MTEANTSYKEGDDVFFVDIQIGNASMLGSPTLFTNKKPQEIFGRIGHTKSQAIDNAIATLLVMKDRG